MGRVWLWISSKKYFPRKRWRALLRSQSQRTWRSPYNTQVVQFKSRLSQTLCVPPLRVPPNSCWNEPPRFPYTGVMQHKRANTTFRACATRALSPRRNSRAPWDLGKRDVRCVSRPEDYWSISGETLGVARHRLSTSYLPGAARLAVVESEGWEL